MDKNLNEQVARKLGHPISGGMIALRSTPHQPEYEIPDYCHSIEAAWEIVDSVKDKFFKIWREPTGHAIVRFLDDAERVEGEADTASMAICLAFLKLP